jgi:steroid 5-alpha reductase family enzyme
MMVATTVFFGLILLLVMVALWDETDRWKFWAIVVMVTVCSVGLRVTSYWRGYGDGRTDAVCEFVQAAEDGGATVRTANVEC